MAASPGSGFDIQSFVHALEQGKLASVIRGFLIVVIILAVALVYLGWKFRGFSEPAAMDHAQIGREIAKGHGWSTQFIRPLAIWQIEKNLGSAPQDRFPDTFNAPLPPLVDALAVKLAGTEMKFGRGEFIAPAERFIVALAMACFLGSVVVQYFLLRRLFDQRLAFWASVLTLVCDTCWQFTLTGLPQMLMLLLFNTALYALVRAIETNATIELATGEALASTAASGFVDENEDEAAGADTPRVMLWLALSGLCFGLLALTHALTIWIFTGALVFAAVNFRRRGPVVLVMLLAFSLLYVPWLVRTYRVCGNPFGMAGYAIFNGLNGSTPYRMRSAHDPLVQDVAIHFFRAKIQSGLVTQVEALVGSLGNNFIAAAFFLCMLHIFRRREVNTLRWGVLVMWLFAVLGMAIIGGGGDTPPPDVHPDQLGVLFLPVMIGFGLAFVLVLFSRREGSIGVVPRVLLFTMLFLASALPLIFTLLPRNVSPVQYPPYLEPAINKIGEWTNEHEVIATDMPWALSWYADRKSLWLPSKFKDLLGLSDDAKLPGTLAAVFVTPVSRAGSFYFDIYKGEYQDYQPLLFGQTALPLFPFQKGYFLLGDLSYTFYAATERWPHQPPPAPAAPADPTAEKSPAQ